MAELDTDRRASERLPLWLVESWAKGFQEVLSTLDMTEAAAKLEMQPKPLDTEPWKDWEQPMWFDLAGSIADHASLSVGCAAETARSLTLLITGEEDSQDEETRETYLELLNQAGSSLSGVLTERMGQTVQFSQAADSSQPSETSLGVAYHFELSGTEHTLVFVASEVLVDALAAPEASAEPPPTEEKAPVPVSDSPEAERPEQSVTLTTHARYNLGMLMNVDLELSVSFGRTTLLLQDVLKLASGSIVELNRSATDPVDLLVNDSIIARGEVVVVEGNYGIRITEIVSHQERLRSVS